MSGEHLDISSEPELSRNPAAGSAAAAEESAADAGSTATRPFIGVQFGCCRVYARIYLNAAGTGYQGHCPRCGRRFEARIDPEGQAGQFFSLS